MIQKKAGDILDEWDAYDEWEEEKDEIEDYSEIKKGRGRPKKQGGERLTHTFLCRLTEQEYNNLKNLPVMMNKSMNQFIRDSINHEADNYFSRYGDY